MFGSDMKILDLFSGIGGFALAAEWVWGDELEIVAFVENDEYCRKVLKKHWPDVEIIGDIRDVISNTASRKDYQREQAELSEEKSRRQASNAASCLSRYKPGDIELLTGGFPCQPFSQAGKRDGRSDNRYLWPEMLRVIRLFKPTWIIAENVRGLLSIEDGVVFEQVCTDLEDSDYDVQTFVIPAVAVDAHHRRDRVWIVAHADTEHLRSSEQECEHDRAEESDRSSSDELESRDAVANTTGTRTKGVCGLTEQAAYWLPESDVGRGSNGIQTRMDGSWADGSWEQGISRVATRVKNKDNRLKCLGNAIVPQVVEQIFRAIKEMGI